MDTAKTGRYVGYHSRELVIVGRHFGTDFQGRMKEDPTTWRLRNKLKKTTEKPRKIRPFSRHFLIA